MRKILVSVVVAIALSLSACDALGEFFGVGGPAVMTRYLQNNYAESIFTIRVQIGSGDIQTAIDAKRLGVYATGTYQYEITADEPTTVTILATSLGTERTFSIDFDDPYSVTQTMLYAWDSATGGFVIWY